MALEHVRVAAKRNLSVMRAFATLTNKMVAIADEELLPRAVEADSEYDLARIRDATRDAIGKVRNLLGAKAEDHFYCDLVTQSAARGYRDLILTKYYIDEYLFEKFHQVAGPENWANFPAHTLVLFDLRPEAPGCQPLRVMWPESVIYQDLCILWNKALATKESISRQVGREHNCMARLAIVTAIHFVEAFLNGAAFNYWLTHEGELNQEEMDLLLEWNSRRGRSRFLKLQEKLLHYPRIMTRGKHPAEQKASDPDVDFLLDTAKVVRNWVVHVPLRPSGGPKGVVDWTPFMKSFEFDFSEKVVDSSVRVVMKIAELVYARRGWLRWLQPRGENGLFDELSWDAAVRGDIPNSTL